MRTTIRHSGMTKDRQITITLSHEEMADYAADLELLDNPEPASVLTLLTDLHTLATRLQEAGWGQYEERVW